jgi:hypothetical protein
LRRFLCQAGGGRAGQTRIVSGKHRIGEDRGSVRRTGN